MAQQQNPRAGHLLLSPPGGAAQNMAIDQLLLQQVDSAGVPVLRIYSWREPTLSLGYFQRYDDRLTHLESGQAACVRRATGGGAILHHHDLTYSIAMPIKASDTQARLRLYRLMHDVFIDSLSELGIRLTRHADVAGRLADEHSFLCFQRRTDDDLVLSGYKVLGSAQRRTRHAVLQHGSLLLRASEFAPQLPGVCDLAAPWVDVDKLAEKLVKASSAALGITWGKVAQMTPEDAQIEAVAHDRFGNSDWLRRR